MVAPSPLRPSLWPLGLIALFATGCVLDAIGGPGAPKPLPSSKRFRIDESNATLRDAAAWAANAWATATGRPITVANDGDIPILLVDEIPASDCPPPADGCAAGHQQILVLSSAADDPIYLRGLILHEMGHILRGKGDHLPDPGNVMYEFADFDTVQELTADDIAFICEGFDCAVMNVP